MEETITTIKCNCQPTDLSEVVEYLELIEAHQVELLNIYGDIQGYFIFFIVVILCFFVYKFFRMFF